MLLGLFCVGHLLLVMGPGLKNGLSTSETPLEKTFLCDQLPTGEGIWVRYGGSYPLPFSAVGPPLVQTHTGLVPQYLRVHMYTSPACIWKVLFLWYPPSPLALKLILPPHLWGSLSSEGMEDTLHGGFDGDILFRVECSKASHSAHCPSVGLCFCFHLLQEEALWWWWATHKSLGWAECY